MLTRMFLILSLLIGLEAASTFADTTADYYDIKRSPFSADIAYKAGDLLTVLVEEGATTTETGNINKKKTDSNSFSLTKLFLPSFSVEEGFTATETTGTAPGASLDTALDYKAELSNGSSHNFTTTIQAEIVEDLGGGQFFIRGSRQVNIHGETKRIFISGRARAKDIISDPENVSLDNTIASNKLADAVIEIQSKGVADLEPGLASRVLHFIFH